MYISQNWLAKYIPNIKSIDQSRLADALTASLAEVEQIIPVRDKLANIVVGEVITVDKHPNSDKLSVCSVNVGERSTIEIICGAPNVEPKKKVAVCLPGGQVYDPNEEGKTIKISQREVRGIVSNGMICSAKELGIADNHEGIMHLDDNLAPGSDLLYILKDVIYEIENKSISHRSDCFSHIGIAREIAAILKIDMAIPQMEELPIVSNKELEIAIDIKVDESLCPRFTSVVVNNIKVAPSPLWMQSQLSAVGVRPINNIVDITNYVMMDKGQPMHAYDYDKVAGRKLTVRKAKSNELVKTLDEKQHQLKNDMLVICDNEGIEDIAGIMGGDKSQVSTDTSAVIFEAANWEMYNIRRTSRELGIRTEASTRFEKGQDPQITKPAIIAATSLAMDIANAEVATEVFDYYPTPITTKEISLSIDTTNRYLGTELSGQEIIEFMTRLKIKEVKEPNSEVTPNNLQSRILKFEIPTYRRDLNIQEDLIEEIARLYGYKNLTPHLPTKKIIPVASNPISVISRNIINSLSNKGFDEVSTYSFIGAEDYKKSLLNISDCVEIRNPIAPELTHMRNTLLVSMIKVAVENCKYFDEFSIYEIARIVNPKKKLADNLPAQPWNLAGLILNKDETQVTYFDIKGYIELLASDLNITLQYEPLGESSHLTKNIFHPLHSSKVMFKGEEIGVIGVVHPEALVNWEIQGRIALFEINLERILELGINQKKYSPISQYQSIKRDLSFWLDPDISYSNITKLILESNPKLIRSVELTDLYKKEKGDTRLSMTLSMIIQSDTKTLTDKEIESVVNKAISEMETKFKAKLRNKA